MLKIHSDYSLKNNNTFGVNIVCSYFAEAGNLNELIFTVSYARERSFRTIVIGEGSNMLFRNDFEGLVIHPLIKGISIVDESESEVLIRAGAGENWDSFVRFCVDNLYYGAENLSLIPGSIGASAVQNIGAYGCEAKDIIEIVEVLNTETMQAEALSNSDCQFGYRDSIFKHGKAGKYIVTHVTFRLNKNGDLNLEYGNVREVYESSDDPSLRGLRNAIISIRENKLPDPSAFHNAGSFFENPVVDENTYKALAKNYTDIPSFRTGGKKIKIPAAWLIDNAGLKGIRHKDVGTWPEQPLVIVNYGGANGKEIHDFSEYIRNTVMDKYGIILKNEVRIIK